MKYRRATLLSIILILGLFTITSAQYTETMDPKGLEKNLKEYGLVDDGAVKDQSGIFQTAINDVFSQGGGILIVPKGTYRLARIHMKSNVHLQIEAKTILKPEWPKGEKTVVFNFSPEPGKLQKDERAFIENVSIRGLGGRFVVDYSDRVRTKGEGVRAVLLKMVKNFLVQDMDVKDNYTTYCGIVLTPSSSKTRDISSWEVTRPTDGTIRNCRIFRASPGYGLAQLHGARRVHFEDLYALGGIALRMESGARNIHVGVHDITGRNITCENGKSAVMMGPHSAKNGLVSIDGVKTISCAYAITAGKGSVKKGSPDPTPGYFADGSSVKNIHAVFGKDAQLKKNAMLSFPLEYYDDLRLWPDNKFLDGPSLGAVRDNSLTYDVTFENITMEGFKYNNDKKIMSGDDARSGNWGQEFAKWKEDYPGEANRTKKGTVIDEYKIEDFTGL